jgi:glycosyltransferase involved in cell wall biosynthesis
MVVTWGSHVVRLVAHLERGRRRQQPFTWSMTVHGPGELLYPAEHLLQEKVRDADLVVAISEYGRAQMVSLTDDADWHKFEVVHCGVDVDRWPRREAEDHHEPLRILTVGRLHPQKSHHVLVQAVASLRDRGVDVTVTLVGEGPTRGQLERQIAALRLEDRVRLVGAVGQSDIGEYFRVHDIFCLASVSEGLPVVLMEAMAAGLPVVTTRITGVPELVEDGRTGLLVPPARPEALADALQRVVEDPELRTRLQDEGLLAVRAGFDSATVAGELEGHLRRVQGLDTTGTPP